MIDDNTIIQDYRLRLEDQLYNLGMNESDILQTVDFIDCLITNTISKELVDKLPPEKLKELDELPSNPESLINQARILGLTEEELTDRYIAKLEEYIANMDKNKDAIRKNIQTA